MNENIKRERRETLNKMQQASDAFYRTAVHLHVHQFVEFAGFMNEYIKILGSMLEAGIDFVEEGASCETVRQHHMQYIAEKLDCIFGVALCDPALRKAFIDTLAEKGGWRS